MKTLFCILALALTAQAQQSEFRVVYIDRDKAVRFINGECIQRGLIAETANPVTLIVRTGGRSDTTEWTNALILALGIIPPSRVIEIDERIPAGFGHLDIIEDHNSHLPFREQRIIGPIVPRVRFCDK